MSNSSVEWDTGFSSFELAHCGVYELRLPGSAGVSPDLLQRLMSGDRHDLVRGSSSLGEVCCQRFAKTVSSGARNCGCVIFSTSARQVASDLYESGFPWCGWSVSIYPGDEVGSLCSLCCILLNPEKSLTR